MKNTKVLISHAGEQLFVDASSIKVNDITLEVWFASFKELEKEFNKLKAQLDKKEEEFKKVALDLF
jgi:predicted mannosyl-3-phosphoglycerate phosphatase (HAD superfamily)